MPRDDVRHEFCVRVCPRAGRTTEPIPIISRTRIRDSVAGVYIYNYRKLDAKKTYIYIYVCVYVSIVKNFPIIHFANRHANFRVCAHTRCSFTTTANNNNNNNNNNPCDANRDVVPINTPRLYGRNDVTVRDRVSDVDSGPRRLDTDLSVGVQRFDFRSTSFTTERRRYHFTRAHVCVCVCVQRTEIQWNLIHRYE